jgi:hypothetical protein
MPNSFFGVNIAKLIADGVAAAGGVDDITLRKVTAGTRTPGSLTSGTNPTSVDYTGKGFQSSKGDTRLGDTLIQDEERILVLLGHTFDASPEVNDEVVYQGTALTIRLVDRDPASATWTVVCNG